MLIGCQKDHTLLSSNLACIFVKRESESATTLKHCCNSWFWNFERKVNWRRCNGSPFPYRHNEPMPTRFGDVHVYPEAPELSVRHRNLSEQHLMLPWDPEDRQLSAPRPSQWSWCLHLSVRTRRIAAVAASHGERTIADDEIMNSKWPRRTNSIFLPRIRSPKEFPIEYISTNCVSGFSMHLAASNLAHQPSIIY